MQMPEDKVTSQNILCDEKQVKIPQYNILTYMCYILRLHNKEYNK